MEPLRKEESREKAPVRHELKGRTLRANGLKFSAMEMGEGPEVVVCLHGFPDHARSFREQMPALAEAGYRVIVPTLRAMSPRRSLARATTSSPISRRICSGGWMTSGCARRTSSGTI